MNCDPFLLAMESDDPGQMHEARRHAASCPKCAAAHAALLEVKAALAVHEPLSAVARAVWENASRIPSTESTRRPKWAPALAGVLTSAAACAVVMLFALSRRAVETVRPIVGRSVNATTTIEVDPTIELVQLEAAVGTLDGNLVALADYAERLEIEREIALMLKQYKRW